MEDLSPNIYKITLKSQIIYLKLLELIYEFSKFIGYKINTQNQLHCYILAINC